MLFNHFYPLGDDADAIFCLEFCHNIALFLYSVFVSDNKVNEQAQIYLNTLINSTFKEENFHSAAQ
jgi:hypothetical protein